MGNSNSGPRRQPLALRILRGKEKAGNASKNEIVAPSGEVTKPLELSASASNIWDEVAPICLAMGTLTVADVRAFAGYCELQATMIAASSMKDGRQLMTLRPDGDDEQKMTVSIDAVLRLERETANALRPYYEYFGLTPVSRARISVPKSAEPEVSKWAGALK